MRNRDITQDIDWLTVLTYFILVGIGWFSIYSATYDDTHKSIFDLSQSYGRQFLWIVSSFLIAILILLIDSKFFTTFAYFFYGFILFLLIMTLLFAPEIKGSRSWFVIGSLKLQPSEFAKFITNLALAKYLSTLNVTLKNGRTRIIAFVLFLVPMLLTLLQGDTGTALVFITFILVLYREGLHPFLLVLGIWVLFLLAMALFINHYYIIAVIAVLAGLLIYYFRKKHKKILPFIIITWIVSSSFVFGVDYIFHDVLKTHQRQRIEVLLGQERDVKGAGYNVNQSKIAIGSGGFLGKGFLKGTQTKFNFVPEQSTDFIFCTIGEEFGFVGSLVLLGLFSFLLLRIIFIAERQRSKFSKVYAYGVASIIFFHLLINIGMTIGLAPVIGIPLPFISYGGSSLWGFTMLLFILLKLDADRLQMLR